MISRIIKVEVGIITRSQRLRLITLTKTLIILDITKTKSNNYCFIILCFIAPNTVYFRQAMFSLRVLSVFSLSSNQQTAPLPPSSTFLCFRQEKTINTASVSSHIDLKNCVSDFWHMRLLFIYQLEDKVRRGKNRTAREKMA